MSDFLVPIIVFVVWLVLQLVVFPRMGVPT